MIYGVVAITIMGELLIQAVSYELLAVSLFLIFYYTNWSEPACRQARLHEFLEAVSR